MPAFSEEKKKDEGTFDSIEALVEIMKEKGVINNEEAEKFIEKYKKEQLSSRQNATVITVIPEGREKEYLEKATKEIVEGAKKDVITVKKEMDNTTEQLLTRQRTTERKVAALEERLTDEVDPQLKQSDWAQRIRWGGDVRVRYRAQYFDKDNGPVYKRNESLDLYNVTIDDDKMQYRVRLAVEAKVNDGKKSKMGQVDAVVRIATGNQNNPVSTNNMLGNYSLGNGVVCDQAFLRWAYQPKKPWGNNTPEFKITAGRIPNPFFHTEMVWDNDLSFEGVAINLNSNKSTKNPWNAFLNLGFFPLQWESESSKDKWLLGGQGGLEFRRERGISAKLGVAYYDFVHTVGKPNQPGYPHENDFTAPLFLQHGNSVFNIAVASDPYLWALASKYQELNITGILDLAYWSPYHIILGGDFVTNLGFDRAQVERLTGTSVKKETNGYQVDLMVGYPEIRNAGEWNGMVAYRYLGADATVDAFTDSDMHLGGTNYKGWILGGELGIFQNVWLKARYCSSDEISTPFGEGPVSTDIFFFDINARY